MPVTTIEDQPPMTYEEFSTFFSRMLIEAGRRDTMILALIAMAELARALGLFIWKIGLPEDDDAGAMMCPVCGKPVTDQDSSGLTCAFPTEDKDVEASRLYSIVFYVSATHAACVDSAGLEFVRNKVVELGLEEITAQQIANCPTPGLN